jgi:hypothetical protein
MRINMRKRGTRRRIRDGRRGNRISRNGGRGRGAEGEGGRIDGRPKQGKGNWWRRRKWEEGKEIFY